VTGVLGANGFVGPGVPWLALAPVLATSGAAMVIVMLQSLRHRVAGIDALAFPVAVIGVLTGGGFLFAIWRRLYAEGPSEALAGAVAVDGLAVFLQGVVLASTLLALLVAFGYLRREGLELRPEHHILVLISATGMMAMAAADDLVVVFVALEVLSIPLYVLAGFRRDQAVSQEASLKYFVLGAFSSAIFLYGVALVYGATGSTDIEKIFVWTRDDAPNAQLLLVGIVLMLVGLGFKVSAVPFHMWTPDVYQGSPTPVTAFMAAGAKTAGFAAILRVLVVGFRLNADEWRPVIWVLAVLTLVVASAAAVVQHDVKRMLAYSSISHAGFILIGVHAVSPRGVSAVLVYLATYSVTVVGTFAVVTALGRTGDRAHALDDYRGVAKREPVLAGALALFLFAQAGIPLTSGFIAKLEVFTAAIQRDTDITYAAQAGDDRWALSLAVIGVLASVVTAFLYLRIVVTMYGTGTGEHDDHGELEVHGAGGDTLVAERVHVDAATGVVIAIAAIVTLWIGFVPASIVDLAESATRFLYYVPTGG
jgi:NADH-quinone oxidoreductase subunit N